MGHRQYSIMDKSISYEEDNDDDNAYIRNGLNALAEKTDEVNRVIKECNKPDGILFFFSTYVL